MKSSYNGNPVPADGKAIGYSGGELQVPDTPIIPFIEGNGALRGLKFSQEKKRSTRLGNGCRTTRSTPSAIFASPLRVR